jgi:DNA-binding NarL/FixJ family response regulator
MAANKASASAKNTPSRVFIVDDHPIVRQGLAGAIEQEQDLTVCGGAGNPAEALQALRRLRPDIAIIDISLSEAADGLELISDLRARHPELHILVLSMHDESVYAERSLRAGAKGYVMKQETIETVLERIRGVLIGETGFSREVIRKIVNRIADGDASPGISVVERLSARELDVFLLIGRGLSTCQIAARLHLSPKTIGTYRERLKEKLGLKDARELLQRAIEWARQAQ